MTEYIVRMPPDMPYEIRAELNAWYVESEPIVRCRDCKYHVVDDIGEACTQFDCWFDPKRFEDGFCAWGERREA